MTDRPSLYRRIMYRPPMSRLAYAGYLAAMLVPPAGVCLAVVLFARGERHGWGVLAMAIAAVLYWTAIAILAYVPEPR